MKMLHVNLGLVDLVSELGEGPNGTTIVRDSVGTEIEATTGYLRPIDERPIKDNSGTSAGD